MNSMMLVPNIKESQNSLLERYIKDIALGNKEALANLYEQTKSAIYGFSLSILRNTHEAEDVLQDVYIKVYENANTYQANGKPLAWMITITKNLALMKIRKKKNHKDVDELKEVLTDNKGIKDAENKLIIDTIFSSISDEERNILVLHSVSGLKHREIAKILGIPLTTVLSKYNRTIKTIKRKLDDERK